MSADYTINIPKEINPLKSSAEERKEHLQNWARYYCAEKLRQRGFVSYNNEDLCWYKIVNGEVMLSVYFYIMYPMYPYPVNIGYGIHPLFIAAPIPHKVTIRGWTDDEIMTQLRIRTNRSQTPIDHYILAPATEQCGAEYLDKEVFPLFDQVHSIEDAYQIYKNRYIEREKQIYHPFTTLEFDDFAIFMNDTEIYPLCLRSKAKKRFHETDKRYALNQSQTAVMTGGDPAQHLALLEARKKRFISKIRRKLGIEV